MTNIKDKPGGRPAKKRIEKQQRVVSTKLTELQYYAIRKLSLIHIYISYKESHVPKSAHPKSHNWTKTLLAFSMIPDVYKRQIWILLENVKNWAIM